MEMALRSARSSSYLGSVLPSKQVVAQEPVTEGVEVEAEAIFFGRDDVRCGRKVQRFELFSTWYQKGARRIRCVVFAEFKPDNQVITINKWHKDETVR